MKSDISGVSQCPTGHERIIAAAPAMLEALEAMEPIYEALLECQVDGTLDDRITGVMLDRAGQKLAELAAAKRRERANS